MKNLLITGGAGFIGSHLVRLMVNKYPEYRIVNLDKLTYAGNLANLKDIENMSNYKFVKADICDFEKMREVFAEYEIDGVIHLAAESHVDRSIKDPFSFAQTNVMGTLSLLQAAKLAWEGILTENCFIMFQRMKCMVLCNQMEVSFWRPQNMILILPIRRRKPLPIIS